MPIIKSAIKRVRVAKRKTAKNVIVKRNNKEVSKEFLSFIEEKDLTKAKKLYPKLQKSIDMMVKKNLWHQNKANRKKSQFAQMVSEKPVK